MSQTRSMPMLSASSIKPLLAGGLIFFLIGLALDIKGVKTLLSDPVAFARMPNNSQAIEQLSDACTSEIVSTAQLSREQLLELLTVPERDSKSRKRQITTPPYCQHSRLLYSRARGLPASL